MRDSRPYEPTSVGSGYDSISDSSIRYPAPREADGFAERLMRRAGRCVLFRGAVARKFLVRPDRRLEQHPPDVFVAHSCGFGTPSAHGRGIDGPAAGDRSLEAATHCFFAG